MATFKIETDDQGEHQRYLVGPAVLAFMWDWEQEVLRHHRKYGDGLPVTWAKVEELWYEHKAHLHLPEGD